MYVWAVTRELKSRSVQIGSMYIGVTAPRSTNTASERVGGWASVFIQHRHVLVQFLANETGFLRDGLVEARIKVPHFRCAQWSNEFGSIAAVCIPSFLLPTIEGWCAEADLFDDGVGNCIPPTVIADGFGIDEFRPQKPVRGPVKNEPWA